MSKHGLCDNTDCEQPGKKQDLIRTVLNDEFDNDICYWCKDCRKRDKDMIK